MNKATFLAVQLNVEDVAASPGLVELLNTHLVFAADVAEAADALVQLASIARLSSGVEASVELPALALERLREALDNLSGYDESWLLALEPSSALFDGIARRHRTLHCVAGCGLAASAAAPLRFRSPHALPCGPACSIVGAAWRFRAGHFEELP